MLHDLLDHQYGPTGAATLERLLDEGADPNQRSGGETLLHVATRRRRLGAVAILLARGADRDATNAHGKTAYAHAARRGFWEVADLLAEHGADRALNAADQLAVALSKGRLVAAGDLLAAHPGCARTGNPEEDRLLADMAGRDATEPVALLIEAGADLGATGLDDGTPLHQAAWFGQPANARLLIDAGALLDVFDTVHQSSPLGWAVHGSRYSGDVDRRQDAYVALVRMLLAAGSSLHYPDAPQDKAYLIRLRNDASPRIEALLANLN